MSLGTGMSGSQNHFGAKKQEQFIAPRNRMSAKNSSMNLQSYLQQNPHQHQFGSMTINNQNSQVLAQQRPSNFPGSSTDLHNFSKQLTRPSNPSPQNQLQAQGVSPANAGYMMPRKQNSGFHAHVKQADRHPWNQMIQNQTSKQGLPY